MSNACDYTTIGKRDLPLCDLSYTKLTKGIQDGAEDVSRKSDLAIRVTQVTPRLF